MNATEKKARIAMAIATALVALYVLTSLLIVFPNKASNRILAGIETSARPFFSQSWRVFAPSIMKSNTNLQAQAQWQDKNGEVVSSEWVDISEIEQRGVAGTFSPSRVTKATWNSAQQYSSRYQKLNAEQKEIIRATFVQVDKEEIYSAKSTKFLTDQLTEHGTNAAQIRNVLDYDALYVEFTGTFMTAYLGHDIDWVRWRLHRSTPNDFNHRFSEVEQFKPVTTTFGWRQLDSQITPEVLEIYANLMKRHGAIE